MYPHAIFDPDLVDLDHLLSLPTFLSSIRTGLLLQIQRLKHHRLDRPACYPNASNLEL